VHIRSGTGGGTRSEKRNRFETVGQAEHIEAQSFKLFDLLFEVPTCFEGGDMCGFRRM
jgi:hypothetical protein